MLGIASNCAELTPIHFEALLLLQISVWRPTSLWIVFGGALHLSWHPQDLCQPADNFCRFCFFFPGQVFLYSELCSHMDVICCKYLLVVVAFPNLQQDLKLCVSKLCVNCQLLTCCLGDNRFSSICNFLPIWISVTVVCDRQLCCCGGSQTRTGPELTNYSQLLPLQVARTELSSLWEAFTDRTIKGYLDFFIKHVYDCPAMMAD